MSPSIPHMEYLKEFFDTQQIENVFSNSKSIKGYRSSYSLPDSEHHESSQNHFTQLDPGEKPLQLHSSGRKTQVSSLPK